MPLETDGITEELKNIVNSRDREDGLRQQINGMIQDIQEGVYDVPEEER